MRRYSNNRVRFIGLIIGAAVVISGVLAGIAIVINDNNKITFGVGQAPVNPCDPDVTVNIVVDRVNEDQYLTGFTYSFVDKPACVGYDIETRILTASDQVKNLFATTSLASDPTVIRVFSTSSTSNWQLGKGSFSGTDATVTQISQSSFQVTFVNPVLLASDLGKILTAEILHLPLGTFNGAAKSINSGLGWIAVSTNSDATSFYIADNSSTSGYIWKSTKAFVDTSTSSLQKVTAIPPATPGTYPWQWLTQSGNGKYVIAVGYERRAYFTQDFGSTWDSVTVSSYQVRDGSINTVASMSNDGSVVCMIAGAGTGAVINLWKNSNFYSKAQSDHYFDWNVLGEPVYDCEVSKDGNYIYIVTKYKLFKFSVGDLTSSRSQSFGTPLLTVTDSLWRVGTSSDGKYVVVGYTASSYPRWKYSSDYGQTFQNSGGTLLNSSFSMGGVKVSNNGAVVATAIYNYGSNGYILTSNDFGRTFSTSSVANNSVYNVAISDDGSRIIGGTIYNGGVSDKIYFLTSD
jgi:hypothetical protein